MSREPQPRTSGFSVLEADERGLVRNGLIDSAANWDSQGKQKLRKGYLQTLQAAEAYVTSGPVGETIAELVQLMDNIRLGAVKYQATNRTIQPSGITIVPSLTTRLNVPTSGTPAYQVEGRLTFLANAQGNFSLESDVPFDSCVTVGTLIRLDGETQDIISFTSDTGLPNIAYDEGTNIIEFSSVIQIAGVTTTLDFTFDNGASSGSLLAGSYCRYGLVDV